MMHIMHVKVFISIDQKVLYYNTIYPARETR